MTVCYQPLGAIEIRRATPDDLAIVADLARRIWRAHYPAIIRREQIEYMLAGRYEPRTMRAAVDSGRLRFDLLCVDGEPSGFAGHGPADDAAEWKLQQLYVLPAWHGRGLGGRLIRRVLEEARAEGRTRLVLTVNRHNTSAIEAYLRSGFTIRDSIDVDIGGGFVMEDYVMVRAVPPGLT